jgi:drug/metabolite transporter (DMT)-like permease
LFSAVVFGFALAAWNLALLWGLVARVTLLFYLSPVWAVLLSYLILGNRPDRVRLLAVLLGIAGAVVLLGGAVGGTRVVAGPAFGRGDAMGLLAGLLFAVSITGARKLPGEIDGRAQTLTALFIALVVSAAFGADSLCAISTPTFPALGVALLVGALMLVPGTMMMLHGANNLDPGRVTLLLLLEIPVAIVSAALLAGESLGQRELAAGAMILTAAALEARPGRIH